MGQVDAHPAGGVPPASHIHGCPAKNGPSGHAEWISGAQEAPWFEDLNREYRAFEAMRPELLKTCLGLFVAVYQGKVVDKDPDERDA